MPPITVGIGPQRLLFSQQPLWVGTPVPNFQEGVPGFYPIPPSMLTDPDVGDRLELTYAGASLAGTGVSFELGTPGVAGYRYSGVGNANVPGGRILATDSAIPPTSSLSPLHTITIQPSVVVPTVAISASNLNAGDTLIATLTNGFGGAQDWLGLFPVGAPDTGYVAWTWSQTPSFQWNVVMNYPAGQYEVRYFRDTTVLIATSTAVVLSTIPPVVLGWEAIAGFAVPQGSSFALTDIYGEAVGELPVWSAEDEAALNAIGITHANGILTHDNRSNVGVFVDNARFNSAIVVPTQPGSLAYSAQYRPLLDGNPLFHCLFGKHCSWTEGPDGSGDWYCWGGDGGTVEGETTKPYRGGGAFGYLKWNPDNPLILTYFYPQVGRAGQTWCWAPDCYTFVKRSNGKYLGLAGYSADPSAIPVSLLLGNPITAKLKVWEYDPANAATAPWTAVCDTSACPFFGYVNESERNFNFAIDKANDVYHAISGGNYILHLNLPLLYTNPGAAADVSFQLTGLNHNPSAVVRGHEWIFCEETRELFWMDTHFDADTTSAFEIWATKVDTGACRLLVGGMQPPYSSFEGNKGFLPLVLVPNRRKLILFQYEFRDRGRFYGGGQPTEPGAFGPAGTGLLDSGYYEMDFEPGYVNPTVVMHEYPQPCKDFAIAMGDPSIPIESRNTAKDVAFFNAWYDKQRDKVYAPFNNYDTIFEFGFTT